MEEKRGSRNSHCYLEIAVIAKLIMVDGSNADWQLGLDLLIARAALDTELANHLTKDARLCCKENGIDLPDQIKLVVCSPDQEVVVKSLPLTQSATFTSIGPEKELVGSSTYNAGGTTTDTNTNTVEEAEVTTTEVQTAETTTTEAAEAEAVVVIVAT